MNICTFCTGILVAFIQTWRMSVIMIPFIPLLLLPGIFFGKALTQFARHRIVAYNEAGAVAEQALSSVRTVQSFVGEAKTVERFSEALESTVRVGLKQGLAKGLAVGSNGVNFALWALMCWYGGRLVREGNATGGQVVSAGFSILIGGMALGNTSSSLRAFSEGCAAAYRIFDVLDRVPPIDSDSNEGLVLEKVEGKLQLVDLQFAYPSRSEQLVLRGLYLEIPAGKRVALVGSSGGGKSTIIGLLERFYDPIKGSVLLDGIDIKKLQLKWFRKQVGLVSQEPTLFATSIKENILYGKEDGRMDEVVSAAQLSNAHNFIQKLPLQYDTQVGERGVQLSGGQKQRIAIARAIIKDPKILLLDEATSALDSESELIVKKALERASVGRTTVVIAHRLSTIRNADLIAVIQQGTIVELGNHEELLAKGSFGAYSALVSLQAAAITADQDRSSMYSNNFGEDNFDEDEIQEAQGQIPGTNEETEGAHTTKFDIEIPQLQASSSLRRQKYKKKKTKKKKEAQKPPSTRQLLALSKPEWKQCLLGLMGAIGFGFIHPFYAFLIANMIVVFYETDQHKMTEKIKFYSGMFVLLSVASYAVNLVQHYNFAAVGEYLTKRVRENMLATILRFEIGWFDNDENLSGAICSRLSTDANMIRTFVADRTGLLTQTGSAIIISVVIAMTAAWRLAVVMLGIQPLIIASFYARKMVSQGAAVNTAKAQQSASQVAGEAVSQHRTIAAFCSQDRVLQIFDAKLKDESEQTGKRAQFAGLCYGIAQFCLLSSWSLSFWYGGILVKEGKAKFGEIFKTFFVLVGTGRVIADAGSLAPDWVKSTAALLSVFEILDRKTKIDADAKNEEVPGKLQGLVQLVDVTFAYPSRPDVFVFRGLSLEVEPGQTCALVGQSGSGKSSIIGLIERFYDPISGKVMLDGKDIKTLHLKSLRHQIGLVSQEPTLFATSIRENIAYGKENATEEEIIAAAHAANAHDFISSLPSGYSTQAGEWGRHLSGGQKQRICIARAILKYPAILLLDEATSALDSQSEHVVQETLNQIMIGRTTIVVAHRLSTIQNADKIAVIQDGCVVEQGTHKQLHAKGEGGAYYTLLHLHDLPSSTTHRR